MRRPVRRVAAAELQRIFNELDLAGAVARDELLAIVESEKLAPEQSGQPSGTLSQTVWYFDRSLQRVALVHQYLRPDGTLGASGRPDPKRLLLHDEILFC